DGLGRNRLDVRAVRKFRVGHDGGRIGIDEDNAVALFTKGFAGLRAGVIKFARLADDDGTSADDEDRMDVSSFGHGKLPGSSEIKKDQHNTRGHEHQSAGNKFFGLGEANGKHDEQQRHD